MFRLRGLFDVDEGHGGMLLFGRLLGGLRLGLLLRERAHWGSITARRRVFNASDLQALITFLFW